MAARLLDDAIDGGQAHAGAFVDRLGGEEGLEDLVQQFGRHARAGVRHLDQGDLAGGLAPAQVAGLPLGQAAGLDGDHARARLDHAAHGVAGVDRQVHDGGFQLALVGQDQRHVATVVGFQPHVLAQQAAQQDGELADQFAQVEPLAPHRRLAREGQQLAHQIGGADAGLADLVQAVIGGVADRVALQQLGQLHLDGGQQVVEVVGHAAGQLAHGLHLLGLRQLQLHRLLRRDVEQPDAALVAFRRDIEVQVAVGIGAGHQLDRTRRPRGQLDPGLGHAGQIEQVAEGGVARGGGAGQDGQRRVGILGLAREQVVAGDDGRAEGSAGGHGAGLAADLGGGGDGGGLRHRQDGVGGGADQETPLPRLTDQDLDLARADLDDGAALMAFAGLGEGHVEGLGRLAARKRRDSAVLLGPGGVVGQDLTGRPDQGGGLGHGVQHLDRRVAVGATHLGPAKGEQPDQGRAPRRDNQDQARRRKGVGAERRVDHGRDRQGEAQGHHHQQGIKGRTARRRRFRPGNRHGVLPARISGGQHIGALACAITGQTFPSHSMGRWIDRAADETEGAAL
ncbi:hypothetical protein D3C85_827890 [compost metagenome]